MEKLIINLDEYQKISGSGKIVNIVLGFTLVIVPGIVIYKRLSAGDNSGDYFFLVLLIILGLNIFLYTFGIFYRISRRYVIVDENCIEYKLSYFYPSKIIPWKDIQEIDIRTLRIYFHKKEGSTSRMKLGEMFYNDIRKLKTFLAAVSAKKSIEFSDTTA